MGIEYENTSCDEFFKWKYLKIKILFCISNQICTKQKRIYIYEHKDYALIVYPCLSALSLLLCPSIS